MRVFKIPYDIKREEKIFGGYLSLRQVLYIMIAVASFGIFVLPLNIIFKILIVSMFAMFFLLCAFLKISGVNFDKLFYYAMKYVFRKKVFIYERCGK